MVTMYKILKKVLVLVSFLIITTAPNVSFAAVSSSLLPIPFGGPITFFGFVPFCGTVIVVGPPKPIVAIYTFQSYKYNPPIPVPPGRPGAQNVVGIAKINFNIICPLPIVSKMGVSLPSL
jgi:hypothetical protein